MAIKDSAVAGPWAECVVAALVAADSVVMPAEDTGKCAG
jgi:hypothetical protein